MWIWFPSCFWTWISAPPNEVLNPLFAFNFLPSHFENLLNFIVVWRVNNFWRTWRFFFFWMLWFFNPFFRSVLIFLMFLGLLGLLSLLMFWGLFRVVGWRILLLRFPLPDCLQFFGLLMLFDFRFFVLGMPGSLLVLLWLVLLCFLLLGCCPLFPHFLK